MLRYLKVYRKKILILVFIIALAYISSVVKDKYLSKVTATATGILMIIVSISFIIWIIKTPTKKDNNQIL